MEIAKYREHLAEQVRSFNPRLGYIRLVATHLRISVVRNPQDGINVGRGTLLGNPFECAHTMESHVDSVMKYRAWLFNKILTDHDYAEEIRELADLAVDGLSLYCPGCCLFKGLACHTQIIAAAIVYLDEVDRVEAEAEAAAEEHFGRYGY